jgi:hypothetical protein
MKVKNMTSFPMKFKLWQQTTDRKESGNTYKLNFKYEAQSDSYYSTEKFSGSLTFSSSTKEKIDAIKENLNILNIGEIFFLGISKDPQKRLDEFLFPDKAEVEEEPDMFEEFKAMAKETPSHELSPRFYELSEEIKKIEAKSRKSKADKERLGFLKKCHEHLEETYYVPPQSQYYQPEEEITEETIVEPNTEEE